jgi:hypothetical protein
VNRRGFGVEVRPKDLMDGWVHFAISSPAVIHRTRLRANTATIRFATGPSASIRSLHVWDGDVNMLKQDGLNLRSSNMENYSVQISGQPEVFYGTEISILVSFRNRSSDAWVQVASAGIDFS